MPNSILNLNRGYDILNFNKIFINSKNFNSSFFFLTNNFFMINNIKPFFKIFLNNNLLINNLNRFNFSIKKNVNFFLKINNKYRNFLRYFKYLFKFKFKYNKIFNYIYFSKLNFKIKKSTTSLKIGNDYSSFIKINNLRTYFKFLFRNWNFLLGYSISPFWWEIYSKKNWIRKTLNFRLFKNRFFFNRISKNNNKKRIRKFNLLNYENYSKKYIINNYFYLRNLNKNKKYSSLRYILKINPNFRLFKKKNYDWFLSKPYLFLNTYKNFKLNKHYSNYRVIFIFKKYFKLFNTLKRISFNLRRRKYKKTNNLFFIKTFFNPDLRSKSLRNKYFKIYSNLKKNFSLFKFHFFFKNLKKKFKKKIKKKLFYIWLFKSIYNGKILRKNKLYFSYKHFFSKKLRFIKSSRKFKKRNIFFKLFKILKKKLISKLFSVKLKKLKSRFKFKYRFKLKIYKINKRIKKKINNKIKKKVILRFKTKYIKLPLKFFFKKFYYEKKFIYKFFFFKKMNNNSIFFKWKIINFTKINKKRKFKFFLKEYKSRDFKKFKNSNILKKTSKPFFLTKTKLNFLLKFYGFLFLNNTLVNPLNNKSLIFSTKKFLYSFSYKNEIQKFILRKYIKNNFLMDSLSKNFIFSNYLYSYNFISVNHYNTFFNNFLKSDSVDNFNFFNFIGDKPNHLQLLLNKNLSSFSTWTYHNSYVDYHKNTYKENYDFNIKRIRFKPGYMTLWRDVRDTLKNSLSLNFRYQYKLTNYLAKYKKFVNFKTFLFMEMKLLNILIKSRLFNDSGLALIFLKHNLIYVNGLLSNNQNLQIFIGDFIQIVINLKYYIISRWFLNLNLKKKNKIKNVIKKKTHPYSHSDEKKKSYNMPKWVLFNKNLFDDCANYLEVDYFTLSVFILYEPFLWSDINPYNLLEQKFSIINLYNWKYIT